MKIGLVIPGGVDRSGRERVVPVLLWLIERLARHHDLHVLVLDYYPEPCTYTLLGATIHDLGRVAGPPGLRRVRIARRLSSAIAALGPFDLLHAYWGMPAGIIAAPVARRLRIPIVVTLNSGEFVRVPDIAYGLRRRWIDRRAVARMIRDASAITVSTRYMAALAKAYRANPIVLPMGVDPAKFGASHASADQADGHSWRLLRVGSINRVKDYPTLLRATAKLPSDVHLDIVGEDTLGGAMQTLAGDLGLQHRVSFHGFQPTDRLADFYARAHLNIVSSVHEAANVTMLEAACAGLPTVGTAVGYVADWNPDRAVAVPTRDPDALASAISGLLRDDARRARLGEAARRWTLAHDADWTANAFERLYEDVVMRRTPRAPKSDSP